MVRKESVKTLVVVTPNLRDTSTGGLIWQSRFAEYAQKVYERTEVIDATRIPPRVRDNRLMNVLYYLVKLLRRRGAFLFVDHNLHVRLSLTLLLGRLMNKNSYAVICHHVVHGLRRNWIRASIERMSEKLILFNAELIIVPSGKTKADIEKLNVRKDKIFIINPTFAFKSDIFRTKKRGGKILFVGNIEPRKGLETLFKALSFIRDMEFSCDIVGGCSGYMDHFDRLRGLVAALNLSDRVIFHGRLRTEGVVECYREANIFVFPSLHEGFGMVLREAMSFGLPIVASDVAPINEIVRDGNNGLLFPPGDEQSLARVLRRLLQDSSMQKRIGKRNFMESRSFPSWDEVVVKTYEVLKPYFLEKNSN